MQCLARTTSYFCIPSPDAEDVILKLLSGTVALVADESQVCPTATSGAAIPVRDDNDWNLGSSVWLDAVKHFGAKRCLRVIKYSSLQEKKWFLGPFVESSDW